MAFSLIFYIKPSSNVKEVAQEHIDNALSLLRDEEREPTRLMINAAIDYLVKLLIGYHKYWYEMRVDIVGHANASSLNVEIEDYIQVRTNVTEYTAEEYIPVSKSKY